ncbi:MAG: 2-dehydro-3-deoxyphosphogluconate aldolase [Lentisphaerae bacterium RIFOXYA12_FULL_48_11]|nr:MAG: 2-dehydro-3-deoxyphosphogluconate aldolase [Lentisphaerae bacterium RIFOXYA12_FULL_48_11]
MTDVIKEMEKYKLVPVVVIENADDAEPLAKALMDGGLPCAEVTFRTAAAADAIKRLSKVGGLLLGAGTVLSIDQVKKALDAGAQFIVSPGFNPKVVGYCVENSIPIVPGVCTPTEIEAAMEFGLKVLKFFPAETYGGVEALKAISAPYSMIKFVPTGGIGPVNIMSYLRFTKVLACGGSWMVKKEAISAKRFDEITRLTKDAVSLVKAG